MIGIMEQDRAWSKQRAPGLAQIEALAREAFARLPAIFREQCANLVIRVEEFPEERIVDHFKLDSPFDLMGLYHGSALTSRSVLDTAAGPDMVFLYRRPILDHWAEQEEALGDLVAHILIHEIGHHFGFSDADMDSAEAQAARAERG